jgi:hypothetical protein
VTRPLRTLAFVLVVGLPAVVLAGAATAEHVCAPSEGQGMCPLGRVRRCSASGALAGCACPPGASAKASASCSVDASAPKPSACVVAASGLGAAMGASLELGELAVPRLGSIASAEAAATVAVLDPKSATASADELVKLAAAHESLEGESAAEAATLAGARRKLAIARRDNAVGRAIAVRLSYRARFVSDARLASESVALARAHLRRRAYGASPADTYDREAARKLLEEVVSSKATGRALRDAAFALGEELARDHAWNRVLTLEVIVGAQARSGQADDPPYVAAARARTAQAYLETGDLGAARGALVDAIAAGVICEPRAECVAAAASARAALPHVLAALGEPARALAPVLYKGAMPLTERVRPLLKLSEIYAAAPGAACAAAAEEARGWAQVVR